MECKHCKTEYDRCSCSECPAWAWRQYCSEECWKGSDEYKSHVEKAARFFRSMTKEQLDFWENEGLWEDEFNEEYNKMIKRRRKSIEDYVLTGRNVR